MNLLERPEVYIDGAWRTVHDVIPVEDPATEQILGCAADAGPNDVDRAVRAARTAFPGWSRTNREERADLLDRFVVALEARRGALVEVVVAEVGAPVTVAREAHVDLALEIVRSYVGLLREPRAEERVGHSLLVRSPVGVVACLTPWNYPVYQLLAKVAPALAAGCCVVAKPAELAPLSTYLVWDAAHEADVPRGVLNLVPGRGTVVGRALVDHPGVDLVSFTGSTAVGQEIAARAGGRLARVSLELGGKSASLVHSGLADIRDAVRATVDSATYNSGQTCSALTRLVVPADRLDEAVALANERAAELTLGDPRCPTTELGPLVSGAQQERVRGFLERAEATGARVDVSPTALPTTGHYLAPTVVSGATPDSEIVQEEVFGPVLVVLPAVDDDHAVRLADDTAYGLAGAVWAATDVEGLELARRLRTGQVDVNGAPFNHRAPFGGFGRSGIGRELGRHGLEELTELTAIQLPVE